MSKTSLIRPLDVLTFGGLGLLSGGLTVYAYTQGVTGEPLALLGFISVVFVAIYVVFLVWRYKFLSKISFTTKHGLHIITNGFPVGQMAVEAVTEETIERWTKVLNEVTGRYDWRSKCEDSIKELFIQFQDFPIQHSSMGKVAGWAVGDNIIVGFKKPLVNTALAHELGHYMYKAYTGTFENTNCHKFMQEHGLK